jgi:outer membrane lipoprotein-sorting protein
MKRVLILLLLVSSFSGFSQVDQKAKSILDQVSERTKNYSSITASFQFIMENAEVDIYELSEGNLVIQGNSFKLNISGIEIFSDGKSQWTFMKDANEVNISDAASQEEGAINPATIFTIYEHGFKNTYLGEYTSGAIKTHKIELIPTEKNEFSRVIIEIDQKSLQIMGAVMYGVDNNLYSIKVKNMDTTKTYPTSTFVFNKAKYPSVNVVDMR